MAMGLQVLHCAKGVHFHAISAEICGKIVVKTPHLDICLTSSDT